MSYIFTLIAIFFISSCNEDLSEENEEKRSAIADENSETVIIAGSLAFSESLPEEEIDVQVLSAASGEFVETEYSGTTDSNGDYQVVIPNKFVIEQNNAALMLLSGSDSILRLVVEARDSRPELSSIIKLANNKTIVKKNITTISTLISRKVTSAIKAGKSQFEAEFSRISESINTVFNISDELDVEQVLLKSQALANIFSQIAGKTEAKYDSIINKFVDSLFVDEEPIASATDDHVAETEDFSSVFKSASKIVSTVVEEDKLDSLKESLSESKHEDLQSTIEYAESRSKIAAEVVEVNEVNTSNCEGEIVGVPYANGASGLSASEPILICSREQFYHFSQNKEDWGKHFILGSNIDLGYYDSSSLEKALLPIGYDGDKFEGSFDGNGFTLKNITLSHSYIEKESNIGLFGELKSAVLKNLIIEDINFILDGKESVGIVGKMNSSSSISRVRVRNINISAKSIVGALVGYNYGGSITQSSAENIIINVTESVAGGLVGENRGSIDQSFAEVTLIVGNKVVGGLVGANEKYITNSYVKGNIQALEEIVGGFTGVNYDLISHCYSLVKITDSALKMGGFSGLGGDVANYSNNLWLNDHDLTGRFLDSALQHTGESENGHIKSEHIEVLGQDQIKSSEIFRQKGFDSSVWNLSTFLLDTPSLIWDLE